MARRSRRTRRGRGADAVLKANMRATSYPRSRPRSKTVRSGSDAQQRLGGNGLGGFDNMPGGGTIARMGWPAP